MGYFDKARFRKVILFIILCIGAMFILNLEVTTLQGIDYVVRAKKIPLYLKLLDFFDRHYNYKLLANEIARGSKTDEERVMRIFEWSHANIRRVPEGLPVIDDHAWHIIIRGYGAGDQASDVFSTLCNYAGYGAFFKSVHALGKPGKMPFSFVKVRGRWLIFDPYRGVYFRNKNYEIASIEEMKSQDSLTIISLKADPKTDYTPYLDNLPSVKEMEMSRANIQSPAKRLLYELKKRIR